MMCLIQAVQLILDQCSGAVVNEVEGLVVEVYELSESQQLTVL